MPSLHVLILLWCGTLLVVLQTALRSSTFWTHTVSVLLILHTLLLVINKRYLSLPSRNLRLLRPDLSLARRIVHQPWSTPIQVSKSRYLHIGCSLCACVCALSEINYPSAVPECQNSCYLNCFVGQIACFHLVFQLPRREEMYANN